MSFETEILNRIYKKNIIVKIGSVYYGERQPDSGLTIDSDKVGIITNARVSGSTVDIRKGSTTIGSISFDLLDKNQIVTSELSNSDTQLLNKEVIIYVGFNTGSFAFSDYREFMRGDTSSLTKKENVYSFSCRDKISLLKKELFIISSTLDGSLTDSATTITLIDATNFPTSGKAKIGDEVFSWSGKTSNDLTSVIRGVESSLADTHDDGDDVFLIKEIEDNVIDLMLQLIVSPGGGSAFDVLDFGLGIDSSLVDLTSFTDIRDANYSSQDFKFFIYNEDDGLSFFEKELLLPTFCRLIMKTGKIGLAILDQIDFSTASTLPVISESDLGGSFPTWRINSNRIVNKIRFKWNYSVGTDKFTRTSESSDADSVALFPDQKTLEFEFRGVTAALGGSSFLTSQASKILSRLKNPRAQIKITTKFNKSTLEVGDKLTLEHRYLPSQGGSLGMSDQLEIMSKSPNIRDAEVSYDLEYPSFSGLRIGVIAPVDIITSVTSQKIFTIAPSSIACYQAGDFIVLKGFADASNEIVSVDSGTGEIVVLNDFTTTLTTSIKIGIANYDEASSRQKGLYAYISPNTGVFVSDGSKSYEIIP